ncbi:hypothetical protein [Bacillus badius]|uniref:Metalloprotease n=1 Tax=Bacillus badius TaxID=1455 RepID=A0ABR5AZB0_BACBA|nr:hypothetical protein [Bacillus badius]KIL75068.1 hypothetical protein SD78_2137 [Bacillus badius]KIL79950.1 hypothetical protein SD77_2404 [Bacillus badius]MED4714982.1 hypothetical protein [Bacillus badius]
MLEETSFSSLMKKKDPKLTLKIKKEFPGARCVGGKYSPADHSVTLFKQDIAIQCERLLGSLERLKEYEWIIFAHELGHALDEELPSLSDRLEETKSLDVLAQIELNAWSIAEELIPFIDSRLFARVKEESLRYFSRSPLVH